MGLNFLSGNMSSRLYTIHYRSQEKKYLNAVKSLFLRQAIPHAVVRYLAGSEPPLKRWQLKAFLSLYKAAGVVKRVLMMKRTGP